MCYTDILLVDVYEGLARSDDEFDWREECATCVSTTFLKVREIVSIVSADRRPRWTRPAPSATIARRDDVRLRGTCGVRKPNAAVINAARSGMAGLIFSVLASTQALAAAVPGNPPGDGELHVIIGGTNPPFETQKPDGTLSGF